MNVFVCDGVCLKLGDFGIVRHQSDRRGIDARTLNPWGVPSDFLSAAAPKWQARDDVYQVGQLLGMLVKGTAAARVRTGEVRRLRCTDHLKEIVYRCIGERRKRYESAGELIDALTHRARVAEGRTFADAEGSASRLHRHSEHAPHRGRQSRAPSRSDRPQRAFCENDRRRPRPPEPASGRRPGRGPEAARDQKTPREGIPHHASQRDAVLAAGGAASEIASRTETFAHGTRRAIHETTDCHLCARRDRPCGKRARARPSLKRARREARPIRAQSASPSSTSTCTPILPTRRSRTSPIPPTARSRESRPARNIARRCSPR